MLQKTPTTPTPTTPTLRSKDPKQEWKASASTAASFATRPKGFLGKQSLN